MKSNNLKIIVIFALLISALACSGLAELTASGETEKLPIVKREAPNLSEESAKIDVDPDSDDLMEEKTPPDSIINNSNKNPENESAANFEQNSESSNTEIIATYNSFGKVKIDMTVSQASQAFGIELIAPDGDDECFYVKPKRGFSGVDFMVIEGVVARIDIESKDYSTDKGAKIGDTEEKIKSLYPGIEVHPQKYDEKLNDMEIYSTDKKYLIIFETDGKVVTGFRIGRAEEVSWVERCG